MRLPLMILVLGFVGCSGGPRIVPVSGRVLIDGKPLTTGYVRVIPENARAAGGSIDSDGRFILTTDRDGDGCVVGKHAVSITAMRPESPTRTVPLVPLKYQDASTSKLTVEITGPTKDLTLELTWGGEQPIVIETENSGDVPPVTE